MKALTTAAAAFVVSLATLGVAAAAPAPPKAKAPTACKRTVVGRGLDRHVVCEVSAEVIVKPGATTPQVLIAPHDGRNVVGRPRTPDRLAGLSHTLD